jgi:high-affinity iron transporter
MLILLLLIVMPALGQDAPPSSEPDGSTARSLVHILDYIAQDYRVAVAGGEVIDAAEYSEMVAFSRNASSLLSDLAAASTLPSGNRLQGATRQLQASIEEKAAPKVVAGQARAIRDRVIAETGIQTAPLQWPTIADGEKLYQQLCTSCHGAAGAGDGPLAPELDPKPTNFTQGDRMASLSPFQAYNTIRMGVEGTAMRAFAQLTDEEIWELAFFVKSLRAAEQASKASPARASVRDTLAHRVSLQQVATLNDRELADVLAAQGIEHPERAAAALRRRMPEGSTGNALLVAQRYLDEALASYRSGETSQARQKALRAYLEGVEPVEPALRARDATLTVVLETRMMDVRSTIEARSDLEVVARAVALARASVAEAVRVLEQRENSPWFSFFVAASILLREGLEAFLVILAILGVLQSVGQQRAARWVHGGWVLAVVLGVIAWLFSDLLIRFGAAQREIMEGGIALLRSASCSTSASGCTVNRKYISGKNSSISG